MAYKEFEIGTFTNSRARSFKRARAPASARARFLKIRAFLVAEEFSGRGKKSNHRHQEEFKGKVLGIVKAYYSDFGPTFAVESYRRNMI